MLVVPVTKCYSRFTVSIPENIRFCVARKYYSIFSVFWMVRSSIVGLFHLTQMQINWNVLRNIRKFLFVHFGYDEIFLMIKSKTFPCGTHAFETKTQNSLCRIDFRENMRWHRTAMWCNEQPIWCSERRQNTDAVGDATLQTKCLCTEMSPALFWAFYFSFLFFFSERWTASLTRHDGDVRKTIFCFQTFFLYFSLSA